MSVKLLTEHHLEFLSLKGGCTGSSESTFVKLSHCWKSHATAQMANHPTFIFLTIGFLLIVVTLKSSSKLWKEINTSKRLVIYHNYVVLSSCKCSTVNGQRLLNRSYYIIRCTNPCQEYKGQCDLHSLYLYIYELSFKQPGLEVIKHLSCSTS